MEVITALNGKTYLHVWRGSKAYETQKGHLFYNEWTNIRFSLLKERSTTRYNVFDIRRALPLAAATFDAVYACRVLEHLTPEEGARFISELRRVLKPGGVCRISVPDLEQRCILYLERLRECLSDPSAQNLVRYRWSVLELIDQMVRERPGGLLLDCLKSGAFDTKYAIETSGDTYTDFFPQDYGSPRQENRKRRIAGTRKALIQKVLRRVKLFATGSNPQKTREATKWMYDRLSLRLLMEKHGFTCFTRKAYGESDIVGWEKYDFDRSNHGDYPIDPGLCVEAIKP